MAPRRGLETIASGAARESLHRDAGVVGLAARATPSRITSVTPPLRANGRC